MIIVMLFHFAPFLSTGQVKQVGSTITGIIVSEKEPVPFCSIILLKIGIKDTAVSQIKLSDSSGHFRFESISPANYILYFQHASYLPSYSTPLLIDSLHNNYTLDIVELVKLKKTLGEVVVKNVKPLLEHKIDRLVFNVSNSTLLQGGDAIEALGKIPGITTIGNNISIVGKSGVRLMVDNRFIPVTGHDLTNYLKAIPSDNIEKIEIITTPPARYEAEGNSGIISIITKKNKLNGYNGTVRSSISQASYLKEDISASINFRKKGWNVFGNIFNVTGKTRPVEKHTTIYPLQEWQQISTRHDKSNYTSYQAGIDYTLNKKSSIGLTYFGYNSLPTIDENNDVKIFKIATADIDSTLLTQNIFETRSNSNSVNLNYVTVIDSTDKKLEINGDYFNLNNTQGQSSAFNSYFQNGQPVKPESVARSKANLLLNIASLKVDFEWPLKWASLSFGGKLSFVSSNSGYIYENKTGNNYVKDIGKSNEFNYRERTQALYASVDKTIGKWELQAGLRGEFTQTKGTSVTINQRNSRNYFELFPTLYFQYTKNDDNVFSLAYGRRINRPGFSDLNPFRFYFNPYRYSEGNPFLMPSFNNNIQLDYTYKSKYSISFYYEKENDYFDQVPLVNPTNGDFYFFMKNIGKAVSYGMTTAIPVTITKWWNANLQVNLYSYSFSSSYFVNGDKQSLFTTYISYYNQFKLFSPKKISADCSFSYFFPRKEGVNNIGNSLNLNVGVKIISKNDRLTFGITGSDIFYRSVPEITAKSANFISISSNKYDTRNIRVTLTYKFGSALVKGKRQHSVGIEDEKSRVK